MGFQTNNNKKVNDEGSDGHKKGVGSEADVESALWNMTINSNAVFIELYEERLWEISVTRGSGPSADVLDSARWGKGNPAPYSKNLSTWANELHDRRRELAKRLDNPHAADPFPSIYKHTFSKPLTGGQNYYYINPSKCSTAPGAKRVGSIRILPVKALAQ